MLLPLIASHVREASARGKVIVFVATTVRKRLQPSHSPMRMKWRRPDALKRTAIFILSSPHSGSTWAGYVLGSNPESAFLGEYHRAWRDSLRSPCILCNARGLDFCEVLSDLEKEPVERAFDLAFARTGKRVVVDSSKDVGWIQSFRTDDAADIRLVHLVRDPRGFFASAKRRVQDDLDQVMSKWCKENEDFRDFIAASGAQQRHGELRSACTVAGNRVSPDIRGLRYGVYRRISTLLECRTSCMGGERRQ